jgi:thymidylate synthase (FAD)
MIKATLKDHMGSDLSVVNAARVSFGKEAQALDWEWYDYEDGTASGEYIAVLDERDTKLVKYLAKHNHISPFGHCFVSFHIKAPIFVARQLVKHKFLRWNEISRRYVDDEPEFYTPDVWRGRSADKKQGSSSEVIDIIDYDGTNGKNGFSDPYSTLTEIALETYQDLLEQGVAPEQARMVLPQSAILSGTGQVALMPSPACAAYVVPLIHSTRAVLLLTRSGVMRIYSRIVAALLQAGESDAQE